MKKGIRNLIFDLGGVIIDLDKNELIKEISDLTAISAEQLNSSTIHESAFTDYEKGLISDAEFRDFFRSLTLQSISDDQIDSAWNAILRDIPQQRLDLLTKLKQEYKVFLLSNTNNIHLIEINKKLHKMGHADFTSFFDKQYYSHLLHERKPDKRIYEIVLEENSLMPSETLFLDDSLDNLMGAEKLGIQTFHVKHPDLVLALFNAE